MSVHVQRREAFQRTPHCLKVKMKALSRTMGDAEDLGVVGATVVSAKRPEVPTLDLGHLKPLNEEVTSHQQCITHVQQSSVHFGGANSTTHSSKRSRMLRLARLAHLDNDTKAKVSRSVQTSHVKSWLHTHGYVVKADKLHPSVTRVIEEWFELVDQDGSRTLEHHELLTALKDAQIPCDDATINEMIHLMDINKDGVIGWDEFEVFMTEEFTAGKSLLSGEYLLPSGTSLNFGVMIGKLKRNKLLRDIMEDPNRRNRWAAIANNPNALGRELAAMQEAAETANLTVEKMKHGGEGSSVVGVTPRTQLTEALVRAMENSRRYGGTRRAPEILEPGRNLAEKLRNGMLTSLGVERPPPVTPVAHEHSSTGFGSGRSTTPRTFHRPFPDPITSPPIAPHSEGNLSACSSVEMLMQMHLQSQMSAPPGQLNEQGSTGVEAAEDAVLLPAVVVVAATSDGTSHHHIYQDYHQQHSSTPSGTGSGPGSSKNNAVARPPASQHSHYLTPPYSASSPVHQLQQQQQQNLTSDRVMGLGSWQEHGSPAEAPKGFLFASGAAAAATSPSCGSIPRGTTSTAFPSHSKSPDSYFSGSDALIPFGVSRTASAHQGAAVASRRGAGSGRGGSASPISGPNPVAGSTSCPCSGLSQQGAAMDAHYMTASYQGHARPSPRIINQVGQMAKKLRAAPGRYSPEPPGLPPAVLAATRGKWSSVPDAGSTRQSTGRLPRATGDGLGSLTLRKVSTPGGGGMATGPPSSVMATMDRAKSEALSLHIYGNSSSALPVVQSQTARKATPSEAVAIRVSTPSEGVESLPLDLSDRPPAVRSHRPSDVQNHSAPRTQLMAAAAWEASAPLNLPVCSSGVRAGVAAGGSTCSSASPLNPTGAAMGLILALRSLDHSKRDGFTASAGGGSDSISPAVQCIPQISGIGHTATLWIPQATGVCGNWPEGSGDNVAAAKVRKSSTHTVDLCPRFTCCTGAVTLHCSTPGEGSGGHCSPGGCGEPSFTSPPSLRQGHCGGCPGAQHSGGRGSRGFSDNGLPVAATPNTTGTATPSSQLPPALADRSGLGGVRPPTDAVVELPDEGSARPCSFSSEDYVNLCGGEELYGGQVDGCNWFLSAPVAKNLVSMGSEAVAHGSRGEGTVTGRGLLATSPVGPQVHGSRHSRSYAATAVEKAALVDLLLSHISSGQQQPWPQGQMMYTPVAGLISSGSSTSPKRAPTSMDGRTTVGSASQATDGAPGSGGGGGCGAARFSSPGHPALGLFGPPDDRPPSRTRIPLVARAEKADQINSSWKAATASLLQLQITRQLDDTSY